MWRCVPLLIAILAATACRAPLDPAHGSAEALASAVLDAFATRNRPALEALALNQQEFHDHVWPSLPAARPERNLPVDFVWGDLRQKSEAGLSQSLSNYGGRRYELVAVQFAGRTDYGPYRVYRDAQLQVRTPSGETDTIRVCGSMFEKDGEWKVFSYVVDE